MKTLILALALSFAPTLRADLVLHYSFEEGEGSTTADLAPVAAGDNQGLLLTPATFSSEAGVGSFSASLAQAGDFVTIAQPGNLIRNVSGFTLSAWVNPTALPASGIAAIVSVCTNSTPTYLTRAGLFIGSNGSFAVGGRRADSNTSTARYNSAAGLVQPGTWTHIAATVSFSSSGNTIRLYLNGAPVDVASISSSFSVGATVSNTASAIAGLGANAPGGANPYDGLMDEVRIYNHALTAEEIPPIAAASESGTLIQLR